MQRDAKSNLGGGALVPQQNKAMGEPPARPGHREDLGTPGEGGEARGGGRE